MSSGCREEDAAHSKVKKLHKHPHVSRPKYGSSIRQSVTCASLNLPCQAAQRLTSF